MSLASYHCSTPGLIRLFCRWRWGGAWPCCRRSLGFRATMAAESSRRRKLTQLMTHHVLGHEQLHELSAIVNEKRVPDKIRHDRAITRPSLYWLAMTGLLAFHFRQQAKINVRSLFQ